MNMGIENTVAVPADKSRREFLFVATASMAAVGAAATAWPFVNSLNPAADTIAAGAPVDVEISKIQLGQQIVVLWRSHPIFVVNRTPAVLKELQAASDINLLADPHSTVAQQPDYARNWTARRLFVLATLTARLGRGP
jgi:ubiquinol-cytochrome c reductase iron-sulfur subunit